MKSLNLIIAQIMSIPKYQEFSITVKYSEKDLYLKEVAFRLNGYHSFSLHLAGLDDHNGSYYTDILIQPARVAPDWEPECDSHETAYAEGNVAEKTLRESLKPFCIEQNLWIQYETLSRWTHAELCSFYPDRPEIVDW